MNPIYRSRRDQTVQVASKVGYSINSAPSNLKAPKRRVRLLSKESLNVGILADLVSMLMSNSQEPRWTDNFWLHDKGAKISIQTSI